MMYILSAIFNIIVILLFNRYDKKKSLSGVSKDWKYERNYFNDWLDYYKGGRSKIYIIFMLISLIPYVNLILSLGILVALVCFILYKLINKINEIITK